ncbi:MAG TPA: polyribonucleotide nucleotidyltransferase [Marinilabiliales bacterium]|nr:MAG: polyribonucleotide nucleotidyltransferase [Bacteroidetes bacterium GWA2_40_14]OFX57217.1 MAG: polyribonucleotide nucleotidyltransferase [Bacteroidetes bacterium GWC2_40_13]OFX72319.1 MAG: polyribonucleotide nucleotidyltransferase [Bacteroidetes bacterium GWD2_40_43]OFX90433.1 MAG: polyribonucleotide nucleotidyltransferase [Bacteroidetes bacterium GWE2_40_63]OFY17321.1 MAG: polyribonucleotide nucleotidyltransferase [Bacteroidetes bacterium GWF2_40_13]OFZ27334.1 MAG: polyribonucleotide n
MKIVNKQINLGDGRIITIETGKLAKQADGAVVVRMGNTMLLATVVAAQEAKEDVDFMPLSVEYKESYSAAGRFPGGFTRREGRPQDSEILVSRLIDRALRPLFPDDFHAETFVTVQLISAEKDTMPDALAGLAASAALAVSNIPFNGPISECRVARIDGKLVINPNTSDLTRADIDIMVGATYDNILMVEGEMKEVSEADMLEAIKLAHDTIKVHCKVQMELAEEVGSTVKREYCHETNDEVLREKIWKETYDKVYAVAKKCQADKHQRHEDFQAVKEEFLAQYSEEELAALNTNLVGRYYHAVEKEAVRNLILDEGLRLDGRKTTEIRPIWSEVDYLPSAHGSAIFTRGETQSLTTCTLGTKLDDKLVDEVLRQGKDRFLLHYNFPPFSTGEARPNRGVGRREIGHGNLAHRALKNMIPAGDENPYSIRIVSDILESNGSSSMATVCAGTLSLMDAGIKIKKPVSGIAMGLITKGNKYAVLSDILGDEDHLGDMDFKVTGTKDGITATQMDIKVDGLPYEVLAQALDQAKAGRMHILGKMMETITEPRADYKEHAPRVVKLTIPKDTIGALIGPGGKIIQEIQASTGTIIVIEEVDNTGRVEVVANNKESIDAAIRRIKGIVAVPEIGEVYKGKVKAIVAFGAFVEILPGKEGLLHISEIEWRRLDKVDEVLKEGDEVEVKLIDVDKAGKFKLSRKILLPKPERNDKKE